MTTARGWLLVGSVALGILVTLAVLLSAGGVPYVTDGNESFSTYNHALNLLRFGPAATIGLTDEASAADAAAHPYVYTHQGNLPRFMSVALLLLGIQSPVAHVAVISLVLGALATAACFRFFARAASPGFAALVCVVFWTDYLLFVQWQVNSYRVWHPLLLFGPLVCTQGVGSGQRKYAIALLGCSVALFYFEFIYAVFVSALVVVYSLLEYRRRLKRVLVVWSMLAGGGAIAIGVLAAQLIAYLGPRLVLRDVQVTYFARNFAADIGASAARAEILRFFLDNHIVFWDSFDATAYLSLPTFARTLSSTVLVVYSPLLATLVMAILGGLALGRLAETRVWWARVLGGLALSIAFFAWLSAQSQFYPTRSAALWRGYLQGELPPLVVQSALAGAWLLGVLLASRGSARVKTLSASTPVSAAGRYLIAGSAGFLVVYILSPGYVYGGYLSRYAPLPVFVTDVALALTIYLLSRLMARPSFQVRGWQAARVVLVAGLAGELLVFMVAYWARLLVTYVTNLPPDGGAFLEQLASPTFQRAGIVSNNYALPLALATNGWAFQDEMIARRRPVDPEGQQIAISGKYMWFRDRDSNPDYLRPRYYVCRTDRNLDTVADLLSLAPGQHLQRCSGEPIVRQAQDGPDQLLASDPGPADMWAVVALAPRTSLYPTWRDATTRTDSRTRLATYAFRTGFYDSEDNSNALPRWTNGHATLELYPETVGDLILSLDLVQPDFGVRRRLPDLTLSLDRRPVPPSVWRADQPDGGHFTLHVPLIVRQTRGAPIVLTLQSSTFVPADHEPGNRDQRQLGVRLEGIRIEESQ